VNKQSIDLYYATSTTPETFAGRGTVIEWQMCENDNV